MATTRSSGSVPIERAADDRIRAEEQAPPDDDPRVATIGSSRATGRNAPFAS
jgi:hypothetical protein